MLNEYRPITGSIQPKNGNLYAVINLYVDGIRKPKWIDTGFKERNGRRQAKVFLGELLRKYNENARQDAERRQRQSERASILINTDSDASFVEFLRAWLPTKLTGTKPLALNTYGSYNGMIEGRIADYFETQRNLLLSELEAEDFEDYYSVLMMDGLTSCTALHHHRMMSQALKYATKKRILLYNVLDAVEAPEKSTYVAQFCSAEEINEMLEAVRNENIYLPILLSAFYGLRRSEVLGLRWSAISFSDMTLSIERKIIKSKFQGKTIYTDSNQLKTKRSRRTLQLVPFVANELKRELAKQNEYRTAFGNSPRYNHDGEGHVCVNELGFVYKPDYLTQRFKQVLRRNGLKRIRFHDLRHSCATVLANNDVPILDIAYFLGHSDSRTTEGIYAHKFAFRNERSVRVLADLLGPHTEVPASSSDVDPGDLVASFKRLDKNTQNMVMSQLFTALNLDVA